MSTMPVAVSTPTGTGLWTRVRGRLQGSWQDLRYLFVAAVPALTVGLLLAWLTSVRFDPVRALPSTVAGRDWRLMTLLEVFSPDLRVAQGIGVALVVVGFLGYVRCWPPVVHERTARRAGRAEVLPLATVSGGPVARLRQLVAGPDTWRRASWAVVSAVLSVAGALLPPAALLAGVRGLLGLGLSPHGVAFEVSQPGPQAGTTSVYVIETVQQPLALTLTLSAVVAGVAWFVLVTPRLARLHAAATTALLRPDPATVDAARLAARVDDLTRTRAGAVDAHGAELRRIERDLHDGTQARLVDVTMRLGMAERAADTDPETMLPLVRDARTSTEEAMAELRTVLRTLYPPVLADRGLRGALSGLGSRCTVRTTVEVDETIGALPAPVEAAAYFLVAESLTNVVKHSVAEHVEVDVTRAEGTLRIRVTDDGLGGADETRGTGITGMRRRVEALDGWLDVTGPLGGPTTVLAEIPLADVSYPGVTEEER